MESPITEAVAAIEYKSDYVPRVYKPSELRPPNEANTRASDINAIIATRNAVPEFFGPLYWKLYERNSAISQEPVSVMLPGDFASAYAGSVSSGHLRQLRVVTAVTQKIIGIGGEDNVSRTLKDVEKYLYLTGKFDLAGTWFRELSNDEKLPNWKGVYEFPIGTGNTDPQDTSYIFLTDAVSSLIQNQKIMHPDKAGDYQKIQEKIGQVDLSGLKHAGLSEWNVWVDKSNEDPKFVGRTGGVEDMFVRVAKKDENGQIFKDLKIGELVENGWEESLRREISSSDGWQVENDIKIDEENRTHGPPIFAVVIDSRPKDDSAIMDDFDPLISDGKNVCSLYIRSNKTASLYPSHVPVDGLVMSQFKALLTRDLGGSDKDLEKFFPKTLSEIPGCRYEVKVRPSLKEEENEIARRMGVEEVQIDILLPVVMRDMQKEVAKRIEGVLGLPSKDDIDLLISSGVEKIAKAMKISVSDVNSLITKDDLNGMAQAMDLSIDDLKLLIQDKGLDKRVAPMLLSPRSGPYVLGAFVVDAYRRLTFKQLEKKGLQKAENGNGTTAVACVPPIHENNRLSVAAATQKELDVVAVQAFGVLEKLGEDKYRMPGGFLEPPKPRQVRERWVKQTLDKTRAFFLSFSDSIRAASLMVSPLWLKHAVGENRRPVNNIARVLNPPMATAFRVGAQMSSLANQLGFGTAAAGDPDMEVVIGISQGNSGESMSYKFAVGTGINFMLAEEIIDRAIRDADKGTNPDSYLIKRIMAYTGSGMAGRVDLDVISERVEQLRNSTDSKDRELAKEAVKRLVIDPCKKEAVDMTLMTQLTAAGYIKLFDEAERIGYRK